MAAAHQPSARCHEIVSLVLMAATLFGLNHLWWQLSATGQEHVSTLADMLVTTAGPGLAAVARRNGLALVVLPTLVGTMAGLWMRGKPMWRSYFLYAGQTLLAICWLLHVVLWLLDPPAVRDLPATTAVTLLDELQAWILALWCVAEAPPAAGAQMLWHLALRGPFATMLTLIGAPFGGAEPDGGAAPPASGKHSASLMSMCCVAMTVQGLHRAVLADGGDALTSFGEPSHVAALAGLAHVLAGVAFLVPMAPLLVSTAGATGPAVLGWAFAFVMLLNLNVCAGCMMLLQLRALYQPPRQG